MPTNTLLASKPKFIGKGAYGCVFSPPAPCLPEQEDGTSPPSRVGKVFLSKRNASDELKLYNSLVFSVDPKNTFTVQFHGVCKPDISAIQESELHKCRFSKKLTANVRQLVYTHGGMSLLSVTNKGHSMLDVLLAMTPLFKGLKLLGQKRMVHQDIKPANVVYQPETGRVSLIDFGLATTFPHVFAAGNVHVLGHSYPYFPPEYIFANGFIHSQPATLVKMSTNFNLFLDAFFVHGTHMDTEVYSKIIQAYFQALKPALEFLKTLENPLKWLTTHAASKVDVYMMGMLLMYLLGSCRTLSVEDQHALADIVIHMIHPAVNKRWSAAKAAKEFNAVIKQLQVQHSILRKENANVKQPLLEAVPVPHLKALAKQLHLKGYSKLQKQGLVKVLQEAASLEQVKDTFRQSCPEGQERNWTTKRCSGMSF